MSLPVRNLMISVTITIRHSGYFVKPVRNPMSVIMVKMYYYTYVLRSRKDGKLYTGYTHRLKERLTEHNDGKNLSTKGRGPFDLVYFEGCQTEASAIRREKQLKSGHGKRYLRTRLSA